MVLSNLGHAYQRMGDTQNAAVYFEKAASAADAPIREDALFNLGLMYAKLGEAEKSRKTLQEILNNHPDSIYFDLVEEELKVLKK
jgi:tetratricopeptide (TPR) repeat protein